MFPSECSNLNGLSSIRNFSPWVKSSIFQDQEHELSKLLEQHVYLHKLTSEGIPSGRLRFNVRKDPNLRNDQRLMLTLVFE